LAKDSKTIAVASQHDSSSMKTVAIMTMSFLPATFFAALFAVPLLQWESSPIIQKRFWVYLTFTLPSTAAILSVWWIFTKRNELRKRLENQRQREKIAKRIRLWRRDMAGQDFGDDEHPLPTPGQVSWVQKVLRRRKKVTPLEEEIPTINQTGTARNGPCPQVSRS
jgi:hypothetical protein